MRREPPAAQPKSRAARAPRPRRPRGGREIEVVAPGEEQHLAAVDAHARGLAPVEHAHAPMRAAGAERVEALAPRGRRARPARAPRLARGAARPRAHARRTSGRRTSPSPPVSRKPLGASAAPRAQRFVLGVAVHLEARVLDHAVGVVHRVAPRRQVALDEERVRRPEREGAEGAQVALAPGGDAHLGARVHEAHHREHAQRPLGRERAVAPHRVALDRHQEVHRDARHLELAQRERDVDARRGSPRPCRR